MPPRPRVGRHGIAAHRWRRRNRKGRRRKGRKGRKKHGPAGVPEPGEPGPTDPWLDKKGTGPGFCPREPLDTSDLGGRREPPGPYQQPGVNEAEPPPSSGDGPGGEEKRRLAIDGTTYTITVFIAYCGFEQGEAECQAAAHPADEKEWWLAVSGVAYTKAVSIAPHGDVARGDVR